VPATINCWIFGLDEAVPAQAEMAPLTAPAVIVGVGFTVMVKVMGVPVQIAPGVIKLPTDTGRAFTGIVATMARVETLITETLFELEFVTYKKLPSEVSDRLSGLPPTVILADASVLVAVLITDTEFEPALGTYARLPSGLTITSDGREPTATVAVSVLVAVLITDTLFEF